MQTNHTDHSNKVIQIVTIGVLSAILLVGQLGLAFLPNIEIVSTLIILYTLTYKRQVFPIIMVFVLLEGIIFGFGIWWISYLYIWPLWAGIVLLLGKKDRSPLAWAAACGAFGLSFGGLCALPYLAGGPWAALSYWAAGIPFDLLHCAGNFVLTLVLEHPLRRALSLAKNAVER